MIPRERLIDTARRVYRGYGFSPIDTPALEYLEILAGKGGEESDKQLYKFQDHGGRWVGLRFDLTVPFARFAAQHIGELGTPLKRYHIATVWRGENTQRGRYREFMQCDFDTIGTRSVAADVETALVIHDLFRAIGFEAFTIHVNNRMVLTGLLERLGAGRSRRADPPGAGQAAQDRARRRDRRNDGRPAPPTTRPTRCSGWPRSPATTTTCCGNSNRWWPAARPAPRASRDWPKCSPPSARPASRRSGSSSTWPSPGDWTTTRARSSRRSSTPCPASAASAPAGVTTTWPSFSRSRNCRASGRRWASTGCWRRWKSWA